MLHDHQQREAATNPTESFIVQAPAGSGKTEILTQRFLRLLTQVETPEQIIALTFTRKAANEMRERILLALQAVANQQTPSSAHQRTTYSYAQQVLAQDQQLGWHLLEQSSRLRIMTIDSLCQMIAHAIPMESHHYLNITEHPKILYWEAARAYVNSASEQPSQQKDLALLLQHMDNRLDLLLNLFVHVLSKRDQWLGPIFSARSQSQSQFEEALTWIETHELQRFCQTLSPELQTELFTLIQTFLEHCTIDSQYDCLKDWHDFAAVNADQATALAGLLLTSKQSLRKGFDHHIGLKRGACQDDIYKMLKEQSKLLLSELSDRPDFEKALVNISHLPTPKFAKAQWAILNALLNSLPLLVAHLELQFQASEHIDFTGVALQARMALGAQDAPTDLALYWDHRIQHILIDEFQDTSIQQFELITQLVAGWEKEDGRTLFVVGDPMQSIYRFRAAEVGLFIRAQTQGIGSIILKPLSLVSNFRSTRTLVEWVNQRFQRIFPSQDDIETGAVSFHMAEALINDSTQSFIQASHYENNLQEAEALLTVIQHELETHPDATLAILVRSRTQLRTLIPLLRQHAVPFQGVDIDLLAHLPHLQDVWSLTQAYLMPSNRLAWLSFLHSPWVGLTLADLLLIAEHHSSIYVALSQVHDIPALSEEGLVRSQYIYTVMQHALLHRQQSTLVDALRAILKNLHIDDVLSSEEQADLEQYWTLITKFETDGQIPDLKLLLEQLNSLYSQRVTPARLQIMTIHKSKGLEFDCVLLPGLGAKLSQKDQPLMRWLKLPRNQAEDLFLISPVKAATDESCRLYDYLGRLDNQKTRYESQRLLYVAVTRAKKRLYLFDNDVKVKQHSFRHILEEEIFIGPEESKSIDLSIMPKLPTLQRLPIHYYRTPPALSKIDAYNEPSHIPIALPRLIGIATHEILQWICTFHPKEKNDIPWQLATDHLKMLGFVDETLEFALKQIQAQIHGFLADPKGQWIAKTHLEEQNEYELLTENGANTRIIDRTFIENNVRWIIDFKTGQWDAKVLEKHQIQVNQYAAIFQENTGLPIRCGLYYLSKFQWIEWEKDVCTT